MLAKNGLDSELCWIRWPVCLARNRHKLRATLTLTAWRLYGAVLQDGAEQRWPNQKTTHIVTFGRDVNKGARSRDACLRSAASRTP